MRAQHLESRLFAAASSNIYLEWDLQVTEWSQIYGGYGGPELRRFQSPYAVFHVYVLRKNRAGGWNRRNSGPPWPLAAIFGFFAQWVTGRSQSIYIYMELTDLLLLKLFRPKLTDLNANGSQSAFEFWEQAGKWSQSYSNAYYICIIVVQFLLEMFNYRFFL